MLRRAGRAAVPGTSLAAAKLVPKLPAFIKGGIFVPSAFFAPFLLAFVPPGTLEPAHAAVEAWVWAVFAVVLAALALLVRAPLLPWAETACLAYALVGLGPLAFALGPPDAQIAFLIGLGFVAVGYCTEPVEEATRGEPWVLALAGISPAVLALAGLPAFGVVLCVGAKAWLDQQVLRTLHQGQGYGPYRRWLTLGAVGYGVAFATCTPEVGAEVFNRLLVAASATGLFVLLGWLRQPALGERTLLRQAPAPQAPSRTTLSRTSSWGTGQSSYTQLPGHYSATTIALAVLILGVGKGALLPHALATRLINGGFPAHVTGLQTLVAALAEFTVLSLPNWCLPSLRLRFCLGLIMSGVHLQVVCALSGSNWPFVLPAASAVGGVASAFVALAVPPLAEICGGVASQGSIQGAEHLGIASSILLVPFVIEATGSGTFVFQIAAYLLIVCGVMFFLEPRPTLKGEDISEVSESDTNAPPVRR